MSARTLVADKGRQRIPARSQHEYDAIIVGAGPAGGQCARELAQAGWRVLLLEKAKTFGANDFSSGGSTLEILSDFDLPDSVVGAFCARIMIASSDERHLWESSQSTCLVLDFMKLRRFLGRSVESNGGELLLGHVYLGHDKLGDQIKVSFKRRTEVQIFTRKTRVLIDATGSERQVLGEKSPSKKERIVGMGIEYLLKIPRPLYDDYAKCLSFFIGLKWMPQGYAWIFPMTPNRLKVGVGRNFPDEALVPDQQSFQFYLDHLIETCLKTDNITVLDKHGKRLSYCCGQNDCYVDQNILAIGDAVSSVNPMTFEGIRHAMMSGRIAAKHVAAYLEKATDSLAGYRPEMRRYCGLKWRFSEILTRQIYRQVEDEKISLILKALKVLSLKGLKDLVFYYKFQSALKFVLRYEFLLIKLFCQRMLRREKR